MNGLVANDRWSILERFKHINELELLTVFNSDSLFFKSFVQTASSVTVDIMSHNMTCVSYINRCRGTRSEALNKSAVELIQWCERRHLLVKSFHIAGKTNVLADFYSRLSVDATDWRLDPEVFRRLSELWIVKVDLFTSSWNKQQDSFVS